MAGHAGALLCLLSSVARNVSQPAGRGVHAHPHPTSNLRTQTDPHSVPWSAEQHDKDMPRTKGDKWRQGEDRCRGTRSQAVSRLLKLPIRILCTLPESWLGYFLPESFSPCTAGTDLRPPPTPALEPVTGTPVLTQQERQQLLNCMCPTRLDASGEGSPPPATRGPSCQQE